MTQQEKIIAYDKAIKVAENIHKFSSDIAEVKRMEQIFPELKVSKDEEIRKEIIEQINLLKSATLSDLKVNQFNSWIDWLEKQGEHAIFFNKIQIGDKVTRNRDGVLVNLSQLNRVAKPAERQGENSMGISETTKKKLEDNLNKALEKETSESWNEFLDGGEQKPADKVEQKGMNIVEEDMTPFQKKVFCIIDTTIEEEQGLKQVCDELLRLAHDESMQKPVCSEEQHENESLSDIENRIINFAMQFHDNRMKPEAEWEDELKMLRDNIKIDPWSEEDETVLNNLIYALANDRVGNSRDEYVNWLKSFKERYTWKPSDLQMEALESATENCAYSEYQDCLRELIEQLKKLRGE